MKKKQKYKKTRRKKDIMIVTERIDRGETMREIIKGGRRKQGETPTNTPPTQHLI